ncbi:MAG: hypothetical protein EXS05_04155 [Planctomycetaceae bacterium]|nr:hypothetical protein [Planctomycetaceae bacterium]
MVGPGRRRVARLRRIDDCRNQQDNRIVPNRLHQVLLISSTLVLSWLAMQAVHELGHVLHAWSSGGRVTTVLLTPLEISRTEVEPNPHPQFVAWGGPVWGSVLPLAGWLAVRQARWSRAWWLRFFAGFCLIANGGYLLAGAFYPVGDAQVLMQNGAPAVALIAFGLAACGPGLALWHRLGPHFGLGRDAPPIDRRAARGATVALVTIVLLEYSLLRNLQIWGVGDLVKISPQVTVRHRLAPRAALTLGCCRAP